MRIGRKVRLLVGALALTLTTAGCNGVKLEIGGDLAGGGLADIDLAGDGRLAGGPVEEGIGADEADVAPAAGDGPTPTPSNNVVKLAVHRWAGSQAATEVVAYLLEKKLGYTVERKTFTERAAWAGFGTGEVDVIVESWGRASLKRTFIQEKKVAMEVGPTGTKGVIGWYVPQWMVETYPDITDYQHLNKYAGLFKTAASGGRGQLLFGSPSSVGNERALVENLNLDLKVVMAGGQAALVKSIVRAQRERRPLLFHFWSPHWLFNKVRLARIKLPPHTDGCDADPGKAACDHAPVDFEKVVSRKFATNGGKAYELVRAFTWTEKAERAVTADIVTRGMTPGEAARKWVEANEATWIRWLLPP